MFVLAVSLFLIFYIYVGYPLLLIVLARLFSRPVGKGAYEPRVSFIISAYNEEEIIREKIENTLSLEYSKDKLEIIVCSDGSTDDTDAIVRSFEGNVRLLRIEGRKGKPECQNQGVRVATGDILVFSDANSMYDRKALQYLLENLYDPTVGVVCGELRYVRNDKSDEGLYWKLEKKLKQNESMLGSCLGANGAIYAMRRSLYRELPPYACSDFVEPFYAYDLQYRVVYEPRAFCTEVPGDNAQEFKRKQRIVLNSFQSIPLIRKFLNPLAYGWYSISLWSHKMLRWYAFMFLILIFFSNLFLLDTPIFLVLFVLQICFYLFALIGMFSQFKLFSIPYYFTIVNLASLLAFVDVCTGQKITAWEKNR